MEEKVIKMNEVKSNTEPQTEKKKLSYEELENVANQLSAQNQQMYKQIQASNTSLFLARMDFLIKIAELSTKNSKHSFSDDFITKVYSEIEEAIFPKEEEVKNEPVNK